MKSTSRGLCAAGRVERQQYLQAMASIVQSKNEDRCLMASNDIGSDRKGRKKCISSRKLKDSVLSYDLEMAR